MIKDKAVDKKKKQGCWSPSVMLKRPDNILSSEFGASPPFIPSYEKDHVDMWLLLSMEYAKIWFKEKENIKKVVLAAQDHDFLVRRYVIRNLLLRKKEEEKKKLFKMKRFQNIPSKLRIRRKSEIDKMMSKLADQDQKKIQEEAKLGLCGKMKSCK